MRFVYVVRFKTNGSNHEGNTKSYRTTAKSPKDAAQRMRSKGRIVSIRKLKKARP